MRIAWRCAQPLVALREGLAELFLPLVCVVCGDLLGGGANSLACGRCWARVARLQDPQCDRCGHPIPDMELVERRDAADSPLQRRCGWCGLLPPYVRAARSVCWANRGTGGDFVHALKYSRWTRLADELAFRMSHLAWPSDVVEERAAILPVPLAAERLRERGFNQSLLLARPLATAWELPVWEPLERVRSTRTQTRLDARARAVNVSGAFAVRPGWADRLRGAHVLLVDDVATTCATLNACADAAFSAGARLISYLTFARAPAAADRE